MPRKIDYDLESRVARVETGMESVTRELGDLIKVVRSQGENTNLQIAALSTAVERAAAPRRTEWGTLISAIMLIGAIGVAYVSPLKEQMRQGTDRDAQLETRIDHLRDVFAEHEKLPMHPVGSSRVQSLQKEVDLVTERSNSRLGKLEVWNYDESKADSAELRNWRLKAMNQEKGKP